VLRRFWTVSWVVCEVRMFVCDVLARFCTVLCWICDVCRFS
jgi:hypothetical protein